MLEAVVAELRPKQWAKNLLVFVPLLVSHRTFEPGLFWAACVAFLAWNFCASAMYVLNDLLDLAADRSHPSKRARPFASGALPTRYAPMLVGSLAALVTLCLIVSHNPLLALVVVSYACATMAYSIWLKRVFLVDVVVLGGLYALRLVAGGVATHIVLSDWLLTFSAFFFASLALAKRYAELLRLSHAGHGQARGRGYRTHQIGLVRGLGIGSGLMATVVFALYVNSPQSRVLYARPGLLWIVCGLLLLWNLRLWRVAKQGGLMEDPVLFAVRDSVSRWLGVAVVTLIMAASSADVAGVPDASGLVDGHAPREFAASSARPSGPRSGSGPASANGFGK
jgi:4-hydroxybenzoate polyprenyltransferase